MDPTAPRPLPWWRQRLRHLAQIAVLGLALAALVVLLAPWWWVGECASHWQLHLLLACLLPVLVLRDRWLLPLVPAVAVFVVPLLAPAPAPPPAPPAAVAPLRLAVANIAWFNPQEGAAGRQLAALEADCLGVVELTAAMDQRLAATWPHRHAITDVGAGAFGIGLYSRHPITRVARIDVGWSILLDAVVAVPGGPVRLLVLHPPPPLGGEGFALRDAVLDQAAAIAAESRLPVVVMGDLNCSPASPAWRRFLAAGHLTPAADRPRTWPAAFAPVGLAIDHVLAGPGLRVEALEAFRIPGSDHRGLMAEIVPSD